MPLTPEQEAEIEAQRADATATRRPTVAALEEVLYEALPVLDHGFVRVVDYMGGSDPITVVSYRAKVLPLPRASILFRPHGVP